MTSSLTYLKVGEHLHRLFWQSDVIARWAIVGHWWTNSHRPKAFLFLACLAVELVEVVVVMEGMEEAMVEEEEVAH